MKNINYDKNGVPNVTMRMESKTWKVGDPYPELHYPDWFKDAQKDSLFSSTEGVRKQIDDMVSRSPEKTEHKYFYFELWDI